MLDNVLERKATGVLGGDSVKPEDLVGETRELRGDLEGDDDVLVPDSDRSTSSPGGGRRLGLLAPTGMYKTLRRCIVSDAHILLHFRSCATVMPYFSATPARESVG